MNEPRRKRNRREQRQDDSSGKGFQNPQPSEEEIIRRTPPRPLRDSGERKPPADDELGRLACEYLTLQRELWPELAHADWLPEPHREVIARMVQAFKDQYVQPELDPQRLKSLERLRARLARTFGKQQPVPLACCYCRYSDPNSDPVSIRDQLRNILRKARQEMQFIPWELVFADYAMSGLKCDRPGFQLACQAAETLASSAQVTFYIDDYTRASRRPVEWLLLACRLRRENVRVIGASDGLDLAAEFGQLQLHAMAMFASLQHKFVRERVLRGMEGAAQRGTVLGRAPFGYAMKPARDEQGNVIRKPGGKVVMRLCIDPETAPVVREIFELFAHRKWSPGKIARHLNKLAPEGWTGWSSTTVRGILRNSIYVGQFVWNRRQSTYDPETGKRVVKEKPESEVIRRHRPELAIVGRELWEAAQHRMEQLRRGGGRAKRSRNQLYPTTLLSGTLFCGYCGRELVLFRSSNKYPCFYCPKGKEYRDRCPLCTSKSSRQLEEAVLGWVRESLLGEEALQQLVEQANAYLEQLARAPRPDVAPLEKKLRQLRRRIDKLVTLVETEEDEQLCQGYQRRIGQLEQQRVELEEELARLREQSELPPPLELPRLRELLKRLRELLQQDVPRAALALRQLLGRVEVRHEKYADKPGARWILHLKPQAWQGLLEVARQQGPNCPESVTLEFLSSRIWTNPQEVTLVVEKVPKYQQIAPQVKQLRQQGLTYWEIAQKLQVNRNLVTAVLRYLRTGNSPYRRSGQAKQPRPWSGRGVYRELAPEVARLRGAGLTWAKVQEQMQRRHSYRYSESTLRKAWQWANREVLQQAMATGQKVPRLLYSRLSPGERKRLREAILADRRPFKQLARELGVSHSTVYRERDKLIEEGLLDPGSSTRRYGRKAPKPTPPSAKENPRAAQGDSHPGQQSRGKASKNTPDRSCPLPQPSPRRHPPPGPEIQARETATADPLSLEGA